MLCCSSVVLSEDCRCYFFVVLCVLLERQNRGRGQQNISPNKVNFYYVIKLYYISCILLYRVCFVFFSSITHKINKRKNQTNLLWELFVFFLSCCISKYQININNDDTIFHNFFPIFRFSSILILCCYHTRRGADGDYYLFGNQSI